MKGIYAMQRQKFYDRDFRTTEEKEDIARKSGNRCCHCGQFRYVHYGATVDHFIPLDKGGCDRFINLIMLCEDCNKDKGNKIVDLSYIPYLKDKYKKELGTYLDNYINTMDYIERNRLFALDEYPVTVESTRPTDFGRKTKFKQKITKKYIFKRATFEDLNKLHAYFIKYLKKVNSLDDENAARENLIFWLTFGCIYYLENCGEISIMTVFTIKHCSDYESYKNIHNIPQMYIFSYYCSDLAINIVTDLISSLPNCILEEQHLKFLPYKVLLLECDKMTNYVYNYLSFLTNKPNMLTQSEVSGFLMASLYVGDEFDVNYQTDFELKEGDKELAEFSEKFDDVTKRLIDFFTKYIDRLSIGWMIYDLMSYDYIKETPLYDVLFDEDGKMKKAPEDNVENKGDIDEKEDN